MLVRPRPGVMVSSQHLVGLANVGRVGEAGWMRVEVQDAPQH